MFPKFGNPKGIPLKREDVGGISNNRSRGNDTENVLLVGLRVTDEAEGVAVRNAVVDWSVPDRLIADPLPMGDE